MKGGVAAMVFAAEILSRLGVRLQGDLIVNTVTDEESSGAGGLAAVRHGVAADAGHRHRADRLRRVGRLPRLALAHHRRPRTPRPRRDGAAALARRRRRERNREGRPRARRRRPSCATSGAGAPTRRIRTCPPGDIVPTVISGGEWIVTYPSSCTAPVRADVPPGERRRRRLGHAGARPRSRDSSCAAPPPTRGWPRTRRRSGGGSTSRRTRSTRSHPIVTTMLDASAAAGEPSRLSGLDSWFDAASFTRFGGTPSIGWGPRDIAWAHTIDEYVPVDDLVRARRDSRLRPSATAEWPSERDDDPPRDRLRRRAGREAAARVLQPRGTRGRAPAAERRGDPRRSRSRVLHAGRRPRLSRPPPSASRPAAAAARRSRRSGCSPPRAARGWAHTCCGPRSPSAAAAGSTRSSCASRPTTRRSGSRPSTPSRASATAAALIFEYLEE